MALLEQYIRKRHKNPSTDRMLWKQDLSLPLGYGCFYLEQISFCIEDNSTEKYTAYVALSFLTYTLTCQIISRNATTEELFSNK